MQQPQKTEESGYHQRGSMEYGGYDGACSTSFGEQKKQNGEEKLLEKILNPNNLNKAYQQVVRNKGAGGVDGMTYDKLLPHLRAHKEELLEALRNGTYKPMPVKRVSIPKGKGEYRKLGIPTVVDRMIQQAINQILQPIFEKEFSEHSYGFRPKRSAHQAIAKAKTYYESGYKQVVDIDMKAYFDTVNHDKLMYLLEQKITDKRVLHLIRSYLKSGIMENGLYEQSEKGTPQGGNLSPLLSNIYLNEFDKLLESRGHKFVRYADDCNIYVKTRRAGRRVMTSVTKYLEGTLKLTVNTTKSAVGSPVRRKFLGFQMHTQRDEVKLKPSRASKIKLKAKLRLITKRSRGVSLETVLKEINRLMTGWINYYGIAMMKSYMFEINGWLRRRIRQYIIKQWKNVRTKMTNLMNLGVERPTAYYRASSSRGYWFEAKHMTIHKALGNEELEKRGYRNIYVQYLEKHSSY